MRKRLSLRGRMVLTAVVAAGVALAVLLLLAGPSRDRRARDQAFASLNEILCEEAKKRPIVILFDDVQWCDESSVSALHYVLRVSPRQPFLLVAAARETEMRDNRALQQAVRSLRHDNLLRELRLEPLTQAELGALIERDFPGVDVAGLIEHCAGNPLLALELARAEAEGGSGESLAELVQERMSRLDAEAVESGDPVRTAANWYETDFPPTRVDRRLKGEEEILAFGSEALHCLHTPGHTPGSIVVWLDRNGKRILFGQDIHGPFMSAFRSNINDWRASMKKVLALEPDILCEGHFGIFEPKGEAAAYIQRYLRING